MGNTQHIPADTEYEFSFRLLPRVIKDEQLFRKAKVMAFFNFGPNWRAVKRWRGNIFKHGDIATLEELKETFSRYHTLRQLEKEQPPVNIHEGWSPYVAKDFLLSENIPTEHYDRIYDENYFSTSEYKKLSTTNILTDTMVYTVEGELKIVTKLSLSFTIHAPFNDKKQKPILHYITALLKNAVHKELPFDMELAIITRQNRQEEDELYCYNIESHNFLKAENGYFTNFSIHLKSAVNKVR